MRQVFTMSYECLRGCLHAPQIYMLFIRFKQIRFQVITTKLLPRKGKIVSLIIEVITLSS